MILLANFNSHRKRFLLDAILKLKRKVKNDIKDNKSIQCLVQ